MDIDDPEAIVAPKRRKLSQTTPRSAYRESIHDTCFAEHFLTTNDHSALPHINLSQEFVGPFVENRSRVQRFQYDYPQPISKKIIPLPDDWTDIGIDVVRKHQKYEMEIESAKANLVQKKLHDNWERTLAQRDAYNAKLSLYPQGIFHFAELLQKNPDPYFKGTYNWYMTGGNVAALEDEDKSFIVRSFGTRHQLLDISPINNHRTKLQHSKGVQYDIGDNEPIYEIRTYDDNPLVNILVRKRNEIYLTNWSDGSCDTFVPYTSKVPYVSADVQNDRLAAIYGDKQLKIYDLNTGKKIHRQDLDYINSNLMADNWGCVRALDENGFILAGRRNIRLCDSRTKTLSANFPLSHFGEFCEQVTCAQLSRKHTNLVYVAMSHRFFAIDLRKFTGEITEKNLVLCWNHHLELPVQTICPVAHDTAEIVIVGSNLIGDTVQMCTEKLKVYRNPTATRQLPSMHAAFECVRQKGFCLDPLNPIHKRIKICITGMTALQDGTLISQNSACDVFAQALTDEKKPSVEKVTGKYVKWFENLGKNVPRKESKVTAVINKFDLVQVMLDDGYDCRSPERQKPTYTPWRMPIEKLAQYKDALAADLMSVWDLPMDNSLLNATQVTYSEKVESWIQNLEAEEVKMEMEEPKLEPTLDESTLNLWNDTLTQTQTQIDFSLGEIATPSSNVRKKSKPKKKHTMGF